MAINLVYVGKLHPGAVLAKLNFKVYTVNRSELHILPASLYNRMVRVLSNYVYMSPDEEFANFFNEFREFINSVK